MRLVVQGNCREFEIPNEFESFFREGIPIDTIRGKEMEMEAYYLGNTLRAYEFINGHSQAWKLAKILNGITRRRELGSGFWYHCFFSSKKEESHMRFTNAAIRFLCDYLSFSNPDNSELREQLKNSLNKHIRYSDFILNKNIWFLHDSLETNDNYFFPRHVEKNIWGKSSGNMLILNTHLDTTITLGYISKQLGLNEYNELFSRSLKTTISVLTNNLSGHNLFHSIDSKVRKFIFRFYKPSHKLISSLFFWMVNFYYWRPRLLMKTKFPALVYNDGYLERDVCLLGNSFQYHLVNVWDLAKLFKLLRDKSDHWEEAIRIKVIIKNGLKYIAKNNYARFIIKHNKNQFTQLCEALGIMFFEEDFFNEYFAEMYLLSRMNCLQSAGMIGFDPLISDQNFPYLNFLKNLGFCNAQTDIFIKKEIIVICIINNDKIEINTDSYDHLSVLDQVEFGSQGMKLKVLKLKVLKCNV